MTVTTTGTTRELASLPSDLAFEDLPREVVDRTEEFFLDWIASALAGRNARPVRILEHFADMMGPGDGPSEMPVYPERSIGLVEVETEDGERFTSRVDVPKADPGNILSRGEIEDKARRLAGFQEGASPEEIRRIIDRVWTLDREPDVRDLLPGV
jgi:2-methylcitrate dehydratase PrpD